MNAPAGGTVPPAGCRSKDGKGRENGGPVPSYGRRSSLIEVFDRVCASTVFTITAQ